MGDNRDYSHDSRFWGFVPLEDVKGKAFLIYYSAKEMAQIRWDRIFKVIN
jgi:signal peptidase I